MTQESANAASIVLSGAAEYGIPLPDTVCDAFDKYSSFLEESVRSVNLTAITATEDVARLHFLDSLAILGAADFKGANVIDVGSGAGFPGVPLKLAEPSISLTLLDATGKRVKFTSDLCRLLDIKAACVHARAEDAAHKNDMRECYDIAVSRAVARLNALCELCLPFLRLNGLFIAMKSVNCDDEIAQADSAIKSLGCELQKLYDYAIPGTDIIHRAVIIRKVKTTPDIYPRRFARIMKEPL